MRGHTFTPQIQITLTFDGLPEPLGNHQRRRASTVITLFSNPPCWTRTITTRRPPTNVFHLEVLVPSEVRLVTARPDGGQNPVAVLRLYPAHLGEKRVNVHRRIPLEGDAIV